MNRSTPGLPVHHQLPEFTQTHVHRVSDAIQPSHPLSSPSPPAPSPSQHHSLFHESTLHIRWPKYWSFSFSIIPSKEIPGLVSFRIDWLDLLAVQGTLRVFSNTTVQKHQFFSAQLSSQSNSHIHTWPLEKPLPWLDGALFLIHDKYKNTVHLSVNVLLGKVSIYVLYGIQIVVLFGSAHIYEVLIMSRTGFIAPR